MIQSKNSKVSLVIPVYNSERYLVPCLESALAQTYSNMEIIAINDGSTDGSAEMLERYSDRIRVVDIKHGGRSAAYNAGIANMTGEYLVILASDDVLYPDSVEQRVRAAERLGSSSATKVIPFFDFQIIGPDGAPTSRTHSFRMENSMSAIEQGVSMLDMVFATFSVSIIHRSILTDVGGYDEEFDIGEDLEFGLRLTLVHGYKFYHVPGIVYEYRVYDQYKPNVKARYHMRQNILRKTISAMDEGRMEEYMQAKRKTSVIRMCRRVDHLLARFAYERHGNAAIDLVARTMAPLLASTSLNRFIYRLTYRIMTVKISNHRASSLGP